MKIFINQQGDVKIMGTSSLTKGMKGDVSLKRASHIHPAYLSLRLLFQLIRTLSSDDKRFHTLVEWTRNWKCTWRVDMRPSGGKLYLLPFEKRELALNFEKQLVEDQLRKGF